MERFMLIEDGHLRLIERKNRLTYEEVRKTLGGPLESVWIPELDAHNISMYCDEEGKLKMKKPSVAFFGTDVGVYDIVAGTVMISIVEMISHLLKVRQN